MITSQSAGVHPPSIIGRDGFMQLDDLTANLTPSQSQVIDEHLRKQYPDVMDLHEARVEVFGPGYPGTLGFI